MPVYTAVTLLLACGGQLSSILKSSRVAAMSQAVAKGLQPHKISLAVCILHLLLRYKLSSVFFSQHTPIPIDFTTFPCLLILEEFSVFALFLPPLSCSWFQQLWSLLHLPVIDALPPTTPDLTFKDGAAPSEAWRHILSPLLYVFGAAVAYWGSALLRVAIRVFSLTLAPLSRLG